MALILRIKQDSSHVDGQAPLTVDHVAERITKLAGSATKDMTGQFLDFDGQLIPY